MCFVPSPSLPVERRRLGPWWFRGVLGLGAAVSTLRGPLSPKFLFCSTYASPKASKRLGWLEQPPRSRPRHPHHLDLHQLVCGAPCYRGMRWMRRSSTARWMMDTHARAHARAVPCMHTYAHVLHAFQVHAHACAQCAATNGRQPAPDPRPGRPGTSSQCGARVAASSCLVLECKHLLRPALE